MRQPLPNSVCSSRSKIRRCRQVALNQIIDRLRDRPTTWKALAREVLGAPGAVCPHLYRFELLRFTRVPNRDGVEIEHVRPLAVEVGSSLNAVLTGPSCSMGRVQQVREFFHWLVQRPTRLRSHQLQVDERHEQATLHDHVPTWSRFLLLPALIRRKY